MFFSETKLLVQQKKKNLYPRALKKEHETEYACNGEGCYIIKALCQLSPIYVPIKVLFLPVDTLCAPLPSFGEDGMSDREKVVQLITGKQSTTESRYVAQVCSIDTYVLFVHSENFHAQLWCSSQGSSKEDTESIVYTIKEVNCGSGIFTAAAICSHATHSMEVWKRALVNTELLFTANNTLPKQGILMTSCW